MDNNKRKKKNLHKWRNHKEHLLAVFFRAGKNKIHQFQQALGQSLCLDGYGVQFHNVLAFILSTFCDHEGFVINLSCHKNRDNLKLKVYLNWKKKKVRQFREWK